MSSTASVRTGRRPRRPRTVRPGVTDGLERLRILLAGAMGAVLVGYALLVPVAAALLASGGSGSADGAFTLAIPMWLAAHRVPLLVEGRSLGVLPLLPTIVVVAVVAVASSWSVRRLGGRVRHDAGAVVAGQAGAAAAVAVLAGALLPGDVSVGSPWASMVGAGLLAGTAAGAGVLRACGLPPAWARRIRGRPRAALAGVRAGLLGLALSGAVVLLAALALGAGAVADAFGTLAPGVAAGAGVLLLAAGYLPNALVAGTAWALGPGVAVGAAQSGPFGGVPGPLPSFPLFAALPTDPAPSAAVLVLLLPLAVGVLVGRACRRALGPDASLRDRLGVAGAAAAGTAVGAGFLAALAGGSLAGGPYDPVSLSPFAVVAAALVLLGVPATIACAGAGELLARPSPTGRVAARGSARSASAPRRGAPGGRTRSDRGGVDRERADPGRSGRARSDHSGSDRGGSDRARDDRDGPDREVADRERSDPGRSDRARSDHSGSERSGSDPARDDRDGPDREGADRETDRGRPAPRTVGELVAERSDAADPVEDGDPPAADTPDRDDPRR